jgi:hypothetical protein
MSKIKETVLGSDEDREFDITDKDLAYIQLFQKAALDSYNYNRELIQRYLAIMAAEQWEYPPDALLNFEIDPENKKIKVSPAKDH